MPLPDLSKYEKFIELTVGKLRYYELGSGNNNTLLLHGAGIVTSADTFQFVAEPLARNMHVYDLDMPSYGKSVRKTYPPVTFDTVIDGIREFIDVMGIGPVNIIGHSAGGWYGAILAYQSPDRVKKLVMVGSAGMNIDPAGGSRVGIEDKPAPMPNMEGTMGGISRSFVEGSSLTPELGREMAKQMIGYAEMPGALESQMGLSNQMGIPEARKFFLLQRMFPYIKTPTLVMWGRGGGKPISADWPQAGTGDTMDPYPTWTEEWDRIGGDISKSSKPWTIPGAKYQPMETGHNVHWEVPEQFVSTVSEFLKD